MNSATTLQVTPLIVSLFAHLLDAAAENLIYLVLSVGSTVKRKRRTGSSHGYAVQPHEKALGLVVTYMDSVIRIIQRH
jgi:hypothetical protein